MTLKKEAKVNVPNDPVVPDAGTVLGVASTDTKGSALIGEDVGGRYTPGISED
ncbi:benenodin family lasso peptide [Luteimonas sp. JM171]|uniref:benenodin family lasso peptide n=1 Tax=Luteimonas sp. JM171 TaxID=1896164 RepID=UPI001F246FE0|nr:benenodin family lasso peptide [Luteimonas sp. JM171]